ISGETNRYPLPANHSLSKQLQSIPAKLENTKKEDTTDVHENRFVSFVLNEVLFFCSQIKNALNQFKDQREYHEVIRLEEKINAILKHDLFRGLSDATYIPFNSPVLQRREGYREILKFWLQFELAAQLIWRGGDEVYQAGKRDVAVLYEYWLFFQLLDVIKELFEIQPESLEKLFESTENGLNLKLKAGRHLLLKGVYKNPARDLCVEYHYNHVFSKTEDYRGVGSWSEQMRPDFTLSLWPEAFTKVEAEQQELMVHIHFDAKYKIRKLTEIFSNGNEDLDQDKEQEKRGVYQRGDLLKMHAYKDAIKRTGGAYVLYPGNSQRKIFRGFHEIIPGLGAFAIRPDADNSGIEELKSFLCEVAEHTINRASKRETLSYYKFSTYRQNTDEVKEKIPEYYNVEIKDRIPPPDKIYVLVGFYKNKKHLNWILENKVYNVRREGRGKLAITDEVLQSWYLLLHTAGMLKTGFIFPKTSTQPDIKLKTDMIAMNYPTPRHDSYYLFEFEPKIDKSFNNAKWDISKLKNYQSRRQSGYPFTTTLAELMRVKLLV
ncbi:MAG TPA: DUF2357 domain-containing protein, partial [Thermotogota bacterium]|nr:DUF2357 domain-containing protein [Thermotogota bacterium]HRW34766.1 DUF2357 domain-containing protein [Thermotogota bacterium]